MRAVTDYVETVCEQILHPTQHPRGWLAAGPWINDAVEYGAHLGVRVWSHSLFRAPTAHACIPLQPCICDFHWMLRAPGPASFCCAKAVPLCLSAAQQHHRQQGLGDRTDGPVTAEDVVAWLSTSIQVVRSDDVGGGLGAAAVNAALHQSHALVHRLLGEAEPSSGSTPAAPALLQLACDPHAGWDPQ